MSEKCAVCEEPAIGPHLWHCVYRDPADFVTTREYRLREAQLSTRLAAAEALLRRWFDDDGEPNDRFSDTRAFLARGEGT